MSVNLLYISPLNLISNGIRYSHNNHNKSDSWMFTKEPSEVCPYCNSKRIVGTMTQYQAIFDAICQDCGARLSYHIGNKDFDLIERVGFHMNHSSTLEHSLIIFDIELSTKALLEFTRHRVGIAYTVTSSRYALDTMGINLEDTKDHRVNMALNNIKSEIEGLLENSFRKDFDNLAMMLPQAFMYKMQVSFNLRSLVHFIELRTNKSAHYSIRKIALEMIDVLPSEYQELVLINRNINKNYKESLNEKSSGKMEKDIR